jgi:hypothetical protein
MAKLVAGSEENRQFSMVILKPESSLFSDSIKSVSQLSAQKEPRQSRDLYYN